MRFALSVPIFAEPARLVALAASAEANGWDGVFVWDHVGGPMEVADPWVVLGAIAARTERIRIGTNVTPLPRRRPHVVARQCVSVDRLSNGRLVLGVGLGNPPDDEYGAFGEPTDRRVHAAMLDEALDVVTACWDAQPFSHHGAHYRVDNATFVPAPIQRPRIPIWVACGWPSRKPLERAARFDGVTVGHIDGSELTVDEVEAVAAELAQMRDDPLPRAQIAVNNIGLPASPEAATAFTQAGATWWLASGWVADLEALAARPPG